MRIEIAKMRKESFVSIFIFVIILNAMLRFQMGNLFEKDNVWQAVGISFKLEEGPRKGPFEWKTFEKVGFFCYRERFVVWQVQNILMTYLITYVPCVTVKVHFETH